ncbi:MULTISPECIES: exodeoxyribonuclease VII small subunit [Atopobiaceae]|uniref:exodeoxyribonuclease VII small subunit n=1 Tax=Atopobiaceae TaxID=1643824 RepID=UPI000B37D007|nr:MULTISPECIES: exodeoxyribonuclease VII small subunit [Atopobiaceae]MCR8908601.1 exodeoxyribonuclease VII small subunit [Thermophilibacter sp. ET337]OUO32744.1 exodeoxyribonuclease VII small subunit [Olsenella sp. An293]
MADETYRPIDEMTFKEASIELEQIVRQLESGDLELEDSLTLYARGVELLKSLRERLSGAEQKVRVLLDATDENASTTDTSSAPSTAYIDE